MSKKVEYRFRSRQGELSALYNAAQARIAAHPDIADKYQIVIRKCTYFESEKEAREYVSCKEKETHLYYRIFAIIEKDEEFYFIQNYYIAVANDEVDVIKAAEYLGMEMIYITNIL